jgi:hypothetical protein
MPSRDHNGRHSSLRHPRRGCRSARLPGCGARRSELTVTASVLRWAGKKWASAPYRETGKPPCDQCACWIPVAPGTPSNLSKSTEIWLTKSDLISATYGIRTKMAKSRGLEKDGRRERILDLRPGAAVQSFVHAKARVYWGFLRTRKPAENMLCGATGGARGFRTLDTAPP